MQYADAMRGFRTEKDWNVCGLELREDGPYYCYWFKVGDVCELVEERKIELPPTEELDQFRKLIR